MTRIRALVAALGARPLFLEPVQHDALAALVSHLPYLAATLLLAQAAEAAGKDENAAALAAWLQARQLEHTIYRKGK